MANEKIQFKMVVIVEGKEIESYPMPHNTGMKVLIEQSNSYVKGNLTTGIRLEVLTRDNYTCQSCGKQAPYPLQVHHIRAEKDGGSASMENLVTLCWNCHKDVHSIDQTNKKNVYESWKD